MCIFKLQRNCCFCKTAKTGIRLQPLLDIFELIFYITFCLVVFIKQETWLAQVSILVFANTFACVLKLSGSCMLLKAEVPDQKTFETPVNSFQCYFLARLAGFTFNVIGFIAQAVVSVVVINTETLYNNPQYGACSFCYKIDQCR